MRYIALALLLAGCGTWEDFTPDELRVGAAQYDYLGATTVPGGHDISSTTGEVFGVELVWLFGAQRPTAEVDLIRWGRMLDDAARSFAAAVPQPPVVITQSAPAIEKPPEPVHPHDTMGLLEWYTDATLFVQVILALLVFAVLGTLILMRKSITNWLRHIAFWMAKKAPPNGKPK